MVPAVWMFGKRVFLEGKEKKMDFLLVIAIAAPVLIVAAVLKALKHTRIDCGDCPTALKASFMNFNEDDSHHLKG